MIQTIQLIKFFYPFIILAVFFCLYKKEYSINRRFCWCMTMYFNARRLFAFLTVGLLIFMNWCCYVTNPNYAVFFFRCYHLLPFLLPSGRCRSSPAA